MAYEFKKNKFTIVKKAISKELAKFCFDYFILKRTVATHLFKHGISSPQQCLWGTWEDPQVLNTYSCYGDIAMETLLKYIKPIMEKVTKLKLNPNYSYARIYKKGDVLNRHKDRFSCEISTTLNLGGDVWSIYLDPTGKENNKGVKINLNPGDMLIYKGNEIEHWREPFDGEICTQVFLHYNNITTEGSKDNIFDKRPHLGLPAYFKK
jgi:hypothetical protein